MPHPPRVPSSAIASFIDRARIEKLLEPWVPDAADRSFVVRCLLDEGPAHHRGANYILLSLLAEALGKPAAPASNEPTVPVPMRLPPHMEKSGDDGVFPIALPTRPLDRLAPAGSPAQAAMIDCLTDGPPQHALANVTMMCLLSVILR